MSRVDLIRTLLVCLVGPFVVTAEAGELPKRYALVVGINDYKHPDLKSLRYAVADATELAGLLRDMHGFEVVLMTRPESDRRKDPGLLPTVENLRLRLAELARKPDEGEVALFFFAGHGGQLVVPGEGGPRSHNYVYPIDARPNVADADTLIDVEADVFGRLERSFGNRVVLIDACRDDVGTRGRGRGDDYPVPPSSAMSVLFASAPGRKSYESPRIEHGLFTHFLLEGLRGKAEDNALRGRITWDSLAGYVKAKVHTEGPKLIGEPGAEQRPELRGSTIGTVELGRIDSGEAVARFVLPEAYRVDHDLETRTGSVRDLAFSGDGKKIFALYRGLMPNEAGPDGGFYLPSISIIDAESGNELANYPMDVGRT